jgi:hypothetical protein
VLEEDYDSESLTSHNLTEEEKGSAKLPEAINVSHMDVLEHLRDKTVPGQSFRITLGGADGSGKAGDAS